VAKGRKGRLSIVVGSEYDLRKFGERGFGAAPGGLICWLVAPDGCLARLDMCGVLGCPSGKEGLVAGGFGSPLALEVEGGHGLALSRIASRVMIG
jgi:hypothetical protein